MYPWQASLALERIRPAISQDVRPQRDQAGTLRA